MTTKTPEALELADTIELSAWTKVHKAASLLRRQHQRIEELEMAFRGFVEFCDAWADFRNGVTDPTGSLDEGNVIAAEQFRQARALLSTTQQEDSQA